MRETDSQHPNSLPYSAWVIKVPASPLKRELSASYQSQAHISVSLPLWPKANEGQL